MSTKSICIARQFGSGGHAIGKLVAEKLGYTFYDRKLVDLAADKGNLSLQSAEKADEQAVNPWLYTPLSSGAYPGLTAQTAPERMFQLQSEIIIDEARRENCVFVGRSADAILEDEQDVELLSLFIYAPRVYRIQRLIETEGYTKNEAIAGMKKKDRQRKNYYNYYTGREHGEPENYDICLDSSYLGIERTAELICSIAEFAFSPDDPFNPKK